MMLSIRLRAILKQLTDQCGHDGMMAELERALESELARQHQAEKDQE
jgi:hypothetical protein